VWHIDKHAQMVMGTIRTNRQLIFCFGKKSEDKEKKVHKISSLHIRAKRGNVNGSRFLED